MSAELSRRIAELAAAMDGTAVTELSLTEAGETITLRRAAAAAIPPDPALETVAVRAPCAGLFLSRHPLRPEPLATIGQAVVAGATLGLLRVGPLLLAVPAPGAGTLLAIDAEEGALVGFGTALFRLRPEG